MFAKPINPLFITDFYKTGHIDQYPEGTEVIYSNFTPRFDKYANVPTKGILVAGVTNFVKNFLTYYWNEYFFKRPKAEVVKEYNDEVALALGMTAVRIDHVEYLHDLGYLPIKLEAIAEGTLVPYQVPVVRVTNTDNKCFWLTNYLETVLSNELWKPMTTAATAAYYKKLLLDAAQTTNPEGIDFVDFQAHDFSMRGMSGWEDATLNGVSHLMFFKGTDTVSAIPLVRQLYGDTGFIGGSVPATEHAVMCAGSKENEADTFNRLLSKVYPEGIVSIVSDTWDFWGVLTKTLPTLRDKIMYRAGKLVIRPDSGDPVKIICGDLDATKDSPEYKGAVEVLWEIFGGTTSSTGYKVLDPHIGLIYGDAITPARMKEILERLEAKGFASTNVVFGVGSYTYNMVSRDTHGFAMKATWAQINGVGNDLFKQPKTDPTKNSAKGRFSVISDSGTLKLVPYDDTTTDNDIMTTYFENGVVKFTESFESVRNRALGSIKKGY